MKTVVQGILNNPAELNGIMHPITTEFSMNRQAIPSSTGPTRISNGSMANNGFQEPLTSGSSATGKHLVSFLFFAADNFVQI